jgi:hypothetical protein
MKTKKPTVTPSVDALAAALRMLVEADRALFYHANGELTPAERARYWRQFDASGATVQAQHEAMICEFAAAHGWQPAFTYLSDRRTDMFTIPRTKRVAAIVTHVPKGYKSGRKPNPDMEVLPYSWHDPERCDAVLVLAPRGGVLIDTGVLV